MAWIDYKKALDMTLKAEYYTCLKMYQIPKEVIQFIEKTMETLRVELTSGGKKLSRVKDPETYITGRCTIAVIVCNRGDATQSHFHEIHSQI